MVKVMLARLLVLLCCISFQACTSTRLIYPAKTEASNSSWLGKIEIGDKLEILLKGEKDPMILKVTDVTSTEIKGENGVVVPIEKVETVEERRYSWIKNTFLVIGIILAWGIVEVKDDLDNLGCKTKCGPY